MPRFTAPNSKEITGILERVPCAAAIQDISEDGGTVVYSGSTEVFWDDQKPVRREDSFVFLDEDGEEHTFDQLTRHEDAEEPLFGSDSDA